jgi:HTH-type transcriptional regulator/antitoxin HigA
MASQGDLFQPAVVPHPGEVLTEYLEVNGWSQRDLARRTGLTPKTISELCNGKGPVTPPTSLLLEKALQRPASFWLNLQRQYDEAVARRQQAERAKGWESWVKKFPIAEMRSSGFLPRDSRATDVDDLLRFLGVSSPEGWAAVWQASGVAFRQGQRSSKSIEAIAVWLRATELSAASIPVAEFSEARLRECLPTLRSYTRMPADEIVGPVQELCGRAGVAVVWVPELKKTAISGCARWLNEKRAVVGLSLRYKTDDQMWFTLFHEIGHLLLHRKRDAFIVDTGEVYTKERDVDPEMQRYEEEASRFAADTLIPARSLAEFIEKRSFTSDAVHEFADANGVSPGIVVGRLQFDGLIEHFQGNKLKQTLKLGFAVEN